MTLDQANYETSEIEKRANGVAVATLNRPERLNAINGQMHHELSTITREADDDPDVKVLVFTGSGRAFSAGGDFSAGSAPTSGSGPARVITLEEARLVVDHLLEMHIPVIAAVNGYAMGLGANFALLCDVVFAGKSAVFADTHVKLGIGAGDGGQVIWPLLMGVNRAKWFLMTGDRLSADEAYDMGLVNFVTEDDALLDEALAAADRLAAGPSQAITASKVPINNWIRSVVSGNILPLSLSMEGATMRSQDAKEAGAAFVEKRDPKFIGR